MIKQARLSWILLLLSLCSLISAGCSLLSKPASASFASVDITGCTAEQICDTTAAVFRENGYRGSAIDDRHLVFTREGSRLETIARDGLAAAQKGESTLVRVRAEFFKLSSGMYRLQCQTYMVIDAGKRLEEEVRLLNIRSGPYQKLLNEVKERLEK